MHNAAGILIVDQDRIIRDVNPSLCRMLRFQPEDLLGQSVELIHFTQETYERFRGKFLEALRSNESVQTEYQFRRQDGLTLWARILGARITLPNGLPGVLWSMVDTSDLHEAQEKLSYQALHDVLTGLPNRRSLDLTILNTMNQAVPQSHSLALVLMDLDNFKPVNDTFGHDVGDEVLKCIAKRLSSLLRSSDFVARMGGDEFVLLIDQTHQFSDLEAVLNKIEAVVSAPIALSNGRTVHVGLSAGVALYPQHSADNPDILLRLADQALYQSKQNKQQRTQFWAVHGEPMDRQLNAVQLALKTQSLVLFYQPIIEVATGKPVAVEALARLKNNHGELIMPDKFLGQLHSQDLLELTSQVMTQAARDVVALDQMGVCIDISINLPPELISDQTMPALHALVASSPIAPSRIIFELLEGRALQEPEQALLHLIALREQGVRLALDDMGIAYSSLQRMRDLPLDKVKLDKTFAHNLVHQPKEINIVRSVQKLAYNSKVDLIVEGIETPELLDVARVMRIPFVQGFEVGRPMPFSELAAFLAQERPLPDKNEPTTLLGVYAALFAHHDLVHKIIQKTPHLIKPEGLCTSDNCAIHHALIRLNITDKDHPIHQAHRALHHALHHALVDKSDKHAITQAREALEDAILDAC